MGSGILSDIFPILSLRCPPTSFHFRNTESVAPGFPQQSKWSCLCPEILACHEKDLSKSGVQYITNVLTCGIWGRWEKGLGIKCGSEPLKLWCSPGILWDWIFPDMGHACGCLGSTIPIVQWADTAHYYGLLESTPKRIYPFTLIFKWF